MKSQEATEYLPQAEAEKLAGFPIGVRRLTKFEEGDMLAAGLEREEIADMTPEALKTLADMIMDVSDVVAT